MVGTVHEAETAQLPQSISPVLGPAEAGRLGLRQRGGGREFEATLRAPLPW